MSLLEKLSEKEVSLIQKEKMKKIEEELEKARYYDKLSPMGE